MPEKQLRRIDEVTWGERLHLAYRRCRAEHGINYLEHAERISEWVPVSDQTLMRLELSEDIPRLPRQRQLLYFVLLSYGYEPETFGLTVDNCALQNWDIAKARKALDPGKNRRGGGETSGKSGKTASSKSSDSTKESSTKSRHSPRTTGVNRGMTRTSHDKSAGQTARRAA